LQIASLNIENFKAIRSLQLTDLGDVVVIAGPNGCGKSCILDAIRLLKSVYAGYRQQNEWHQFFGEFQLNMQNTEEVLRLFFDKSRPVKISAQFVLSPEERKYIRDNVTNIVYRTIRGQQFGLRGNPFHLAALQDPQILNVTSQAEAIADAFSSNVLAHIDDPFQVAELTLANTPALDAQQNTVLQFAFGVYDPEHIGIIDYHSANRTYQRERVGGINVNIEETSQRLAQHALYNWQNKYTNIKSELAAAYIRDLFAERAGGRARGLTPSILETMKELFDLFLPGKRFEGPTPGISGELTFPVTLDSGAQHDIDDLSSGEKELVYGYLRLRNVAPINSIILLDEPELHLNPRLVLGLPSFYRKHLGTELKNQLWMTTHSDAFLRDAYKGGGFTIFHMSAPSSQIQDNQAVAISADDEINQAVVDLVGDIAGFRPGNKIVIFESSESSSFDASMTKRLFPEFFQEINALSGDNKFGVRQLYTALNKAAVQMNLPSAIYAITDRDSDLDERPALTRPLSWDVYHIENYLLEEEFIAKVISDNPSYGTCMDNASIYRALQDCAQESLRSIVIHRMRAIMHSKLVKGLDLGFDPATADIIQGFAGATSRVVDRVKRTIESDFGEANLLKLKNDFESQLKRSLDDGTWKSEFRGRDILKLFAGRFLRGLPYEAFRDSIVARMGDSGFKPPGMKKTIEAILMSSR
jgi:predicted ATPase